MPFLVLSPEVVAHLLHGEKDELTPENEARIQRIKAMACVRCGSALHPRLNDRIPFGTSKLPKLIAGCDCGYAVDPESGLVVELGSATKVTESIPLLKR